MRIDLHVHSTFSDGVFTPAALVEIAVKNQVSVLSISDHDCVDGIPEAEEAARGKGVDIVPGVELSSEYLGRDLHILGYGFDTGNGELKNMLQRFRETRHKRGIEIVGRLKAMGVDIELDEVLSRSTGGALGRPHIAEALIDRGVVKNHAEAFNRYLGEHTPAYVKKYKISPAQAIDYIHSSGGLAFIAHPGNYLDDEERLNDLISYGFDGIEVIHPNHGEETVKVLTAIASKYGLLISGGTDFHGFSGKDIPLGDIEVPLAAWQELKKRLAKDAA